MNVRFQVFVSSTQKDLRDERATIIQELTKVGYIAVGMEQFPATDEEQFEYIQIAIDESDYYIVILKGRYGSETLDGISYTEKEFDYAISQKKPILAFLYESPGQLRLDQTDEDPDKLRKLFSFRSKLEAKKIVRYWADTSQLVSSIKDSLNDLARRRPGIGWVRGDQAADPSLYKELETLRKENLELQSRLAKNDLLELNFPAELSHGEDEFSFEIVIKKKTGDERYSGSSKFKEIHRTKIELSWNKIFTIIMPLVHEFPAEYDIKTYLERSLKANLDFPVDQSLEIASQIITDMGYQYEALGVIRIVPVSGNYKNQRHWEITDLGRRFVAHLKAIRRDPVVIDTTGNSSAS